MLIGERIQNEIGLMKLAKISQEDPDFYMISKFFYILMDEAGFTVTWESVFDNMFDVSKKDNKALLGIMADIMPMLLPNFKTAKKKTVTRKKKK